MKSLRRAILFWMALLLSVVGAVSAAITYEYVKDETQSSFDAEIRQVAEFLQREDFSIPKNGEALAPPNPENLFLIQVWTAEGRLIRSSDNSVNASLPTSQGFTTQNLGQADWRSYNIANSKQIIRVSLPLDERNEQASSAALQIAIPMGVVIPLSWLVLSLLIDRILSGLESAAQQVRARKPGDSTQFVLASIPSEIVPFIETINKHVSQIQAQAEGNRQFLSDAAHELRTPLSALTIQIENLKSVLKTREQRERVKALEAGSSRANLLVSRLLQLARHEASPVPSELKVEGLLTVLQAVFDAMQPLASQRRIQMIATAPTDIQIYLDGDDMRQVLEALADNAIRYARPDTVIELNVTTQNGHFEISLADEGPGISEAKLPRVFERFYRAAPHLASGTGLGLSIAKAICDKHGWSLQLQNRPGNSGLVAIISGKGVSP